MSSVVAGCQPAIFGYGHISAGLIAMQALEGVTLVLVDLALLVYLSEKAWGLVRNRRKIARLVNHHPEMRGVDPEEDSLFVFESDDSLKAFVLQNNEPGVDEPFYVSEDDYDQE